MCICCGFFFLKREGTFLFLLLHWYQGFDFETYNQILMSITVYIIHMHESQLIAKNRRQFFENTWKCYVFICCHADKAGILGWNSTRPGVWAWCAVIGQVAFPSCLQ